MSVVCITSGEAEKCVNVQTKKVMLSCYRHVCAKGKRKYSPYSFLISTLYGMSRQRHSPADLYPRDRTPVPTVQKAGWASDLVRTQRLEVKSFTSARDLTPGIQSVVIHYD
jgi:hypothetical protein